MDVSVIIVCMNRPDILFPCLDGIIANTRCSYEIMVVAYRFSPDNLEALKAAYPGVKVLENNELCGFSENNNIALKEACGRFCFIVNDDTLMNMPVIDTLLADFDRLPEGAAAVSPRIVFPDGRVQTCGRAPWNARRYMRHYLHLVDETKPGRWTMNEGLFQTWTLNGACFLARTDAFREAGWFDETFTFTPEDIALGQKFNAMGYTVWTDADAVITHIAGGTVSRMESAIKPTRVRGALIYYSGGSKLKYALLGCYVCAVEACRHLRYLPCDRSDPDSRAAISFRTSGNVLRTVFSGLSTKEIFTRLYNEL